jgi:hypothetical protein
VFRKLLYRRVAILLPMLLGLSILPSCGTVDQSATAKSDQEYADGRVVQSRTSVERPQNLPQCTHATVELGNAKGAIDIRVKCTGRRQGAKRVDFSLGRYSLRGRRSRQGILSIRHRPALYGAGSVGARKPRCVRISRGSWVRDGVHCDVLTKGELTIGARIWVRPKSQCAMGVSVTSTRPPRCNRGGFCYSNQENVTLTQGRPRGC